MPDESDLNRQFRKNMRGEREARGMSQGELSRRLIDAGWPIFHQTTINRIESGTRPVKLDEAMAIADALGVDLEELTWDALTLEVRRIFRDTWLMRAELGSQGWDYFLQTMKLRRVLERHPDGLPDENKDEADHLIRERPGEAAEHMLRDSMERFGLDSYDDFAERWHAQVQEKWERMRREANEQHPEGESGDA